MIITDCYWEKENLNKKVVECVVTKDDTFNENELRNAIADYDYACVKVPVGKADFNFGLADMGFTMIECQYKLSKNYKKFNFDDILLKRLLPKIKVDKVNSDEMFNVILDNMSVNMFSTDRIVLDPNFEAQCGFRRYQNWMKSEYSSQKSLFLITYYKEKPIGFGMYRPDDLGYDALLGGVFEEYQGLGLGLITCCQAFIYGLQHLLPFRRLTTSISSNNVPVVEIYNYFDYKITETRYVFIKHNNDNLGF